VKKGELYMGKYGLVRVISTSRYGVLVRYFSGKFKGREARIEKGMMKKMKRHYEACESNAKEI
jgi:hypothetical protein